MQYIAEAGDVVGYELRIAFAGGRLHGVLQIAEGVPSDLMLVEITQRGSSVAFTVPEGGPYACEFRGEVIKGSLHGTFRFKNGGEVTVTLPKGKSYWD